VPYPAACEPQAWSVATPFALARVLFEAEPAPGDDHYAVPAARPDRLDTATDALSIPRGAVDWSESHNGN
jgi:glycogen debranching enzyme